jgi:O-antigen/teichoic acid export membrane protein
MKIANNINKISWTAADKATFVLYGIASIVLLKVTNSFELGLFALFNNLHNLIFAIGNYLGLQSLLHFSSDEKQKPVVNFYAIIIMAIIIIFLNLLIFLTKNSLSNIFNEPHLIDIIHSLMILMIISIPRNFNVIICYREMEIWRLFVANFVYFGTMSGIIFYNVLNNIFLTHSDLINITYIGSALSVLVGTILNIKYWKFKLPNKNTTIKYKDIISYSAKFSIGVIANTLPRTLDVYVIQFFFGTNIVGLYAPAKTIFRFVEDLTNTIYNTIYSSAVKYFTTNDIVNINKLISKSISLMFVFFVSCSILCWIFGSELFNLFLPQKFISALSILNYLMLTSILFPFTLISTIINAEGKPELVSKYNLIGVIIWFITFVFIGTFFSNIIVFVAIPYIVFVFVISILFVKYATKNYNLKLSQFFRFFPDTYNFIMKKRKI